MNKESKEKNVKKKTTFTKTAQEGAAFFISKFCFIVIYIEEVLINTLFINGSPNKNGNIARLVGKASRREGIEHVKSGRL